MGVFFENGELKDEINTLSSQNGVFYGDKDLSIFYNDVELIGENYIFKSDSMTYNSFSKEAITFGFTEIKSEDSVMIESMGGVFRQETNYSKLSSSKVETDQYILEGDIINYDDENSIYYASKNVRLKIKESDYYVFGDEGIYFKDSNNNGIWDSSEKYKDQNYNGKWDQGEYFEDIKKNFDNYNVAFFKPIPFNRIK